MLSLGLQALMGHCPLLISSVYVQSQILAVALLHAHCKLVKQSTMRQEAAQDEH